MLFVYADDRTYEPKSAPTFDLAVCFILRRLAILRIASFNYKDPNKQKKYGFAVLLLFMRMTGLEPACRTALEPKSSVSANSTTSARITSQLYHNEFSMSRENCRRNDPTAIFIRYIYLN